MRELEYTITVRVAVDDDRVDVDEVTGDLVKLLASEQARKLLQEPAPARYGDAAHTWWLESAQLTDAMTVLGQQAGSWARDAEHRDRAARTAHTLGNATLAAQRAEAAHWLRYCAEQVIATITGKPGDRGEFARQVPEGTVQ